MLLSRGPTVPEVLDPLTILTVLLVQVGAVAMAKSVSPVWMFSGLVVVGALVRAAKGRLV